MTVESTCKEEGFKFSEKTSMKEICLYCVMGGKLF